MRRGNEPAWIIEDGKFIGVNLSSDFCAEHEWGIEKIRRTFPDTTETNPGLEGLKMVSYNNDCWRFFVDADKDGPLAVLKFDSYPSKLKDNEDYDFVLNSELKLRDKPFKPQTIAAAWDEGSFGINARGLDGHWNLEELWVAAKNCDLACWLGGGQFIENPGLIVVIASRVPQKWKDDMKASCEDKNEFKRIVKKVQEETNIKERLKAYGLNWFALSPRRAAKQYKTKYPIVFWLNPNSYKEFHQWNMLFGIVTIEMLEEFLAGNDSVLVTNPKARSH